MRNRKIVEIGAITIKVSSTKSSIVELNNMSSSSELSNDEHDYETYSFEYEEDARRPWPLISKRSRLLAAAAQNDVETLKELLDSRKWYKVKDEYGLNLLQIAILRENDEVFDYLVSLDDFPLEAVDGEGATALVVALSYYVSNDIWMGDRYAYELIKKGADIDKISREGQPLLHCALERSFVRVARLLLERGADVNMLNHEGETPLHMCFYCDDDLTEYCDDDLTEAITMLLCYGADPSICFNNDNTVLDVLSWRSDDFVALENLLFFTVDEWSSLKIHCKTLFELAQKKSPFFHQVIKFASEVICDERLDWYGLCLFTIDSEYLDILLEKYPYFLKELLQSFSGNSICHLKFHTLNLKNFDMLLQSSLGSDTGELISKINRIEFIPYILGSDKNIDEIMGIIYYLLSYGMSLYEINLELIYKRTGYSNDFKNLLFFDVEKQTGEQITEMMPRLIYEVTLDIHKIVEDRSLCKFIDWEEIFKYFVHPKIQNAYCQIDSNEVIVKQLPQVPLLQELSRDAFRQYFIKTFKITTAKQFYSLIKSLPISSVHEKILTFESKLYQLKN